MGAHNTIKTVHTHMVKKTYGLTGTGSLTTFVVTIVVRYVVLIRAIEEKRARRR